MGGMSMLIDWAARFPLVILNLKYIAFATGAVGGTFILGSILVSVWKNFRDAMKLRAICLPATMSRVEIAQIFTDFATPQGQLRFVRALERGRITATDAWPSEFKLSVGQGEPTCALARLEERWLRLDR